MQAFTSRTCVTPVANRLQPTQCMRATAASTWHHRPSRCVRSGLTRATVPEGDENKSVPVLGPESEQQQQYAPATDAAAQQEQAALPDVSQPSPVSSPELPTMPKLKKPPLRPQQQQATAQQQQPLQQQAPAQQQQLQQKPQQQKQQQVQQQQRGQRVQPRPPPYQQSSPQQQQQQQVSIRKDPSWFKQLAATLQHMPAALTAFIIGGFGACFLLFGWAKGSPMRKNQPYTFTMEFQEASKIDVGTPVRMKGVQIGTVTRVVLTPSQVTAYAEVPDHHNVIPRSSRVDINLLGLAADPWIDITPPAGCLIKKEHGPHHSDCEKDGLIVCSGGHIAGQLGGSTDFMTKMFLRRQDRTRVKTVDVHYHSRNV